MPSDKRTKLFILSLVAFFPIATNSQNCEADLRILLANTSLDTTKVKLLYKLSDCYTLSNYDSAIIYAKKALKLAQNIHDEKGEARSLTRIGNIFIATRNWSDAWEAHYSSLAMSEKINDFIGIAASCNNISLIYKETKNTEDTKRAVSFLMRAKTIFETQKKIYLATCMLNIGDAYESMSQLDSAWFYQKQAYNLGIGDKDEDIVGASLSGIGRIFLRQGKVDSAFKSIRLSIKSFNELNDVFMLAMAWSSLAECFENLGQVDSSIYYAKKSFYNDSFVSNSSVAKQLSRLYESQGRYDSATRYLKMAVKIDSTNDDQEKTLVRQALHFHEQLQQEKLEEQKAVDEKKRKNNLQVITISVFIITFFIALVILSQKKINPRVIEILGVLGLLLVFEFVTIFVHPFIGELTHHTPVYMLLILVIIAAILGPLHHFLTKWLKEKLVLRTAQARSNKRNQTQQP